MSGAAVTVRDVSVCYPGTAGELVVLDDVSLDVGPGTHVAIVGHSGAGKSTLLALIGGLEPVQAGSIRVGDADVANLARDALAAYRRLTVGFVFQHFGLIGTLTAQENVELAMVFAAGPRRTRRERAEELLDAVGLGDRRHHRPSELSGGEAQRVAVARALANSPSLILADEPTGNLDGATGVVVLEVLEHAAGSRGCTLITVTHDHAIAARADRVVELADGRVVPA